MIDFDLEYKEISIKPEWSAYPYGPAYHLSLIVDGKVYYKFSAVTPEDVIEECLKNLKDLLTEDILVGISAQENNEKIS